MQDLKFAFRQLRKTPGFTAVAVLSLALGIGANTAIFSVVNTVLLRPLPFADPARLVMVWGTVPQQGIRRDTISYPDYQDWREQNRVFEDIALLRGDGGALSAPAGPMRVRAMAASSSFFPLLGVKPFLGRIWTADEDRAGNGRVMVLTHGFWQRDFWSDPQVLGKQVRVDANVYTIIGVLPRTFRPYLGCGHEWSETLKGEYWTSLAGSANIFPQRGMRAFHALGRLRPGVTPTQAQSQMDTIAARSAAEYSGNQGRGVNVAPLRAEIVKDERAFLTVLLGSVVLILLIVCANLANLLLARANAREKEMGIRAALGASAGRLIRQTFTESLALAGLGGAMGWLLACWAMGVLRPFLGAYIPRSEELALDGTVLGYTLAVSLAAGGLLGLAPMWLLLRRNLLASLQKGAGRATGMGHRAYQDVLVVAEIALTLVLLTGAGLLGRSFVSLVRTDLGMKPEQVLTFSVDLPYVEAQRRASFWRDALTRIEVLPGVKSVGATSCLPFKGDMDVGFELLDDGADLPAHMRSARLQSVSAGYFSAMGMRLVKGRLLDSRDEGTTEGRMIINETMAKRFWPDRDPIGKRLRLGLRISPKETAPCEIVGIVGDTKQSRVEADVSPEMLVPYTQLTFWEMAFTARTTVEPEGLLGAIRKTIADLDPAVPVFDVRTMEARIADTFAPRLASILLLGAFSLLALLLSALGIYGVMAYAVGIRRHEIGIRMALGAQSSDVMGLVFKRGMTLAGIGGAVGGLGAVAAGRLLRSMLYQTQPTDPVTFVIGPLLLITVALLACWLPARRAAKLDPIVALRSE